MKRVSFCMLICLSVAISSCKNKSLTTKTMTQQGDTPQDASTPETSPIPSDTTQAVQIMPKDKTTVVQECLQKFQVSSGWATNMAISTVLFVPIDGANALRVNPYAAESSNIPNGNQRWVEGSGFVFSGNNALEFEFVLPLFNELQNTSTTNEYNSQVRTDWINTNNDYIITCTLNKDTGEVTENHRAP